MKKLIPILTVLGFVLAVGLVYADEAMPAKDLRSKVQDDGITYMAPDNAVTFVGVVDTSIECSGEGGMAAGGLAEKEVRKVVQDDRFTYIAPDNAVSFSASIPEPGCSWARGLGRDLILQNGITIPGGTDAGL